MRQDEEAIEQAINWLVDRRTLSLGDRKLRIAFLIPGPYWRPLSAPWWHKKSVSIIGADLDGNFFLRHCDGSVRYWNHGTQTDTAIASSVREFCANLTADPNDTK